MLTVDKNPWIGLLSYGIKDADSFFGRDNEIETLCASIKQNYSTVIYGKSGMGKTSLINAGLIPTLSKEGFFPVSIRLSHNSKQSYAEQIVTEVKAKLEASGCEIESIMTSDNITGDDALLWFFFHTNIFWTQDNNRVIPVVFIDQFEEIFTLSTDRTKVVDFFRLLNELFQTLPSDKILNQIESKGIRIDFNETANFRLVLAMREDFLPRLEDYCHDIPSLRKNRVVLAPMTGKQALEVIMKPDPDIVHPDAAIRIIEKVSKKKVENQDSLDKLEIEICILSLFCSQLYKQAANQKKLQITGDLVDKLGDDIIDDYYSDCIKNISKESMIYLEDNLLTNSGYRNALAYEDVVPVYVFEDEIKHLEKTRLLRIEEVNNNVTRIEFTHDVLCRVALEHKKHRQQQKNRRRKWSKVLYYLFEMLLFWAYAITLVRHSAGDIDQPGLAVLGVAFSISVMLSRLYMLRIDYRSFLFSLLFLIFNVFAAFVAMGALVNYCPADDECVIIFLISMFSCSVIFVGSFTKRRSVAINEMFIRMNISQLKYELWGFFVVSFLCLSCIAGYYLIEQLQIACMILLLPTMHVLAYLVFNERLKSPKAYISTLVAFCLLAWFFLSQYIPHHNFRWLIPLMLLPVTYFGLSDYLLSKHSEHRFASIAKIVVIWAAGFIVLPNAILGYNINGLGHYVKTGYGTIEGEYNRLRKRFIIVKDEFDHSGAITRSGDILLPVQFNAVKNTAVLLRDYFEYEIHDVQFDVSAFSEEIESETALLSQYPQCDNCYIRELVRLYEEYAELDFKRELVDCIEESFYNNDGYENIQLDLYSFRKYNQEFDNHFDPKVYETLANYYSAHNEDSLAYRMLDKYVKAKIVLDETNKFLDEGNWSSEDIYSDIASAVSYLYIKGNESYSTISDTDIMATYKEDYVKYFKSRLDYHEIIDSLIVHDKDILSDTAFYPQIINMVEENHHLLALRNEKFNNQVKEMYGYQRAIGENYSPVNNSFALIFMGDYIGAEQLSLEAIEAFEDSLLIATASTNLLTSYMFRGDFDAATEILKQHEHEIVGEKFYRDWIQQDISYFEKYNLLPSSELSKRKYKRFMNILKFQESVRYDQMLRRSGGGFWAFVNPMRGNWYTYNFGLDKQGGVFFMDEDGRRITDVFEDVIISNMEWDYDGGSIMCDPIFIYVLDGKRGYYDLEARSRMTGPEFDHAWFYSDGLAGVVKDGKVGFMDASGNLVISYQYDYIPGYDYMFKDGLARIYSDYDKVGLIDKTGKIIVPIEYDNISDPHDGLVVVRDGDRQGVLDMSGNLISPMYASDVIVDDGHFAPVGNVLLEETDLQQGVYYQDVPDNEDPYAIHVSKSGVYEYESDFWWNSANITCKCCRMGDQDYVVMYCDETLERTYLRIFEDSLEIIEDNILDLPEGTRFYLKNN